MPDLSQDPTVSDFQAWISGTGLIDDFNDQPAASVDYETTLAAVVRDWKRATNYRGGFLTGNADQTYIFYARDITADGRLRFGTGLKTLTSVTVGGTALTLGTDFVLDPPNAALQDEPYQSIIFLTSWYCSGTVVIEVAGRWGYNSEYPPDVWILLLARAAQRCFPQLGLQISGGVAALKADDVSVQFSRSTGGRASAGGPLSQETDTISAWWRQKVLEYRV